MFKSLKVYLFIILSAGLLLACGDSDAPQEQSAVTATETSIVQLPAEVPDMPVESAEIEYLPSQVVYQEEIYNNWPYTVAPSENQANAEAAPIPATEESAAVVANTNPQSHTINAEARIFRPDTIYINPGDTVGWTNMTSHNTVSVEGLIPEGAMPWAGKLGQNLKIKLDVEGIYAYVCQPHIGFGMVGVIVVGKPTNLEKVTQYAKGNLQGPFRRLIGKLIKVKIS